MVTWKSRLTSQRSMGMIRNYTNPPCGKPCPVYMRNWKKLMNKYRRRDLTVASDRVIAFAGVAQAFQAQHGLTYLAGIWSESMPHCLLWSVGSHSSRPSEHPASQVPSWSWFSCPIAFGQRFSADDDYMNQEDYILEYIPRFSARLVKFQWSGYPVNALPQTSFHDFAGYKSRSSWLHTPRPSKLSRTLMEIGRLIGSILSAYGRNWQLVSAFNLSPYMTRTHPSYRNLRPQLLWLS
jgi:hypothetical protein